MYKRSFHHFAQVSNYKCEGDHEFFKHRSLKLPVLQVKSEQTLESMDQDYQILKSEVKSLNEELRRLILANQKLSDEKLELQLTISDLESRFNEIQSELKQQQSVSDIQEGQLINQKQQIEDLNQQIFFIQIEKNRIQDHYQEEYLAKQYEIDALRDQLELQINYKKQIEELQDEIQKQTKDQVEQNQISETIRIDSFTQYEIQQNEDLDKTIAMRDQLPRNLSQALPADSYYHPYPVSRLDVYII